MLTKEPTYQIKRYICTIKLKTERPNRLGGKNNKKVYYESND